MAARRRRSAKLEFCLLCRAVVGSLVGKHQLLKRAFSVETLHYDSLSNYFYNLPPILTFYKLSNCTWSSSNFS